MTAKIIQLDSFRVGYRHWANGIQFPQLYRVTGHGYTVLNEGRQDEGLVQSTEPEPPSYSLSPDGGFGLASSTAEPIRILDPVKDRGCIIVRHHLSEAAAVGYIACVMDMPRTEFHETGKGNQLAQIWRAKQLQYSLMRSLMGRHRDFWGLTEDGLVWASKNLKVDLTPDNKKKLMDAYLSLAAFPDVKPGLEALKQQGVKLAILSNGEPKMLEAAAKSAGIRDLLDEIISVEEVKIFKVSPRVYNLGPERMKVTNPELGFVSANSWDAAAAASAGLRTFWIQRTTAEVPEELGFQADTIVKAITDLTPLLRG